MPKGRMQLSQVLRGAGEIVSVDDVSGILQVERLAAAKLLARWNMCRVWTRRNIAGFTGSRKGVYELLATNIDTQKVSHGH